MKPSAKLQRSNHRNCRHKTRFASEAQAAMAGASIGLRFYKCSACGCWHLTSKVNL